MHVMDGETGSWATDPNKGEDARTTTRAIREGQNLPLLSFPPGSYLITPL